MLSTKSQLQRRIRAIVLSKGKGRSAISKPDAVQTEQGLTLIECLVAVFVTGLMVSLITPPIFIAVASRAQSRRAEQALQVAQGEVDRIRVMVTRSQHEVRLLPKTVVGNLQRVAPPSSLVAGIKSSQLCNPRYDNTPLNVNQAVAVDVDGDCNPELFMQVFRTAGTLPRTQTVNGVPDENKKPSDFELGVRVYSILASGNRPGNSWANLLTEPASLGLVNGEGGQRLRPLAVLYTPFSWSDKSETLCDYFQDNNPNSSVCSSETP
ncbi:hypothetical protein IFO70_18625 [Phormidium tenue FACHB-886]|nr:hypothetical protein [Phormidium tenue FACHB-886]